MDNYSGTITDDSGGLNLDNSMTIVAKIREGLESTIKITMDATESIGVIRTELSKLKGKVELEPVNVKAFEKRVDAAIKKVQKDGVPVNIDVNLINKDDLTVFADITDDNINLLKTKLETLKPVVDAVVGSLQIKDVKVIGNVDEQSIREIERKFNEKVKEKEKKSDKFNFILPVKGKLINSESFFESMNKEINKLNETISGGLSQGNALNKIKVPISVEGADKETVDYLDSVLKLTDEILKKQSTFFENFDATHLTEVISELSAKEGAKALVGLYTDKDKINDFVKNTNKELKVHTPLPHIAVDLDASDEGLKRVIDSIKVLKDVNEEILGTRIDIGKDHVLKPLVSIDFIASNIVKQFEDYKNSEEGKSNKIYANIDIDDEKYTNLHEKITNLKSYVHSLDIGKVLTKDITKSINDVESKFKTLGDSVGTSIHDALTQFKILEIGGDTENPYKLPIAPDWTLFHDTFPNQIISINNQYHKEHIKLGISIDKKQLDNIDSIINSYKESIDIPVTMSNLDNIKSELEVIKEAFKGIKITVDTGKAVQSIESLKSVFASRSKGKSAPTESMKDLENAYNAYYSRMNLLMANLKSISDKTTLLGEYTNVYELLEEAKTYQEAAKIISDANTSLLETENRLKGDESKWESDPSGRYKSGYEKFLAQTQMKPSKVQLPISKNFQMPESGGEIGDINIKVFVSGVETVVSKLKSINEHIDKANTKTLSILVDDKTLNGIEILTNKFNGIIDTVHAINSQQINVTASDNISKDIDDIVSKIEEINQTEIEVKGKLADSNKVYSNLNKIKTALDNINNIKLDIPHSNDLLNRMEELKGYIDSISNTNITISGIDSLMQELNLIRSAFINIEGEIEDLSKTSVVIGFKDTFDELDNKLLDLFKKVQEVKTMRVNIIPHLNKADWQTYVRDLQSYDVDVYPHLSLTTWKQALKGSEYPVPVNAQMKLVEGELKRFEDSIRTLHLKVDISNTPTVNVKPNITLETWNKYLEEKHKNGFPLPVHINEVNIKQMWNDVNRYFQKNAIQVVFEPLANMVKGANVANVKGMADAIVKAEEKAGIKTNKGISLPNSIKTTPTINEEHKESEEDTGFLDTYNQQLMESYKNQYADHHPAFGAFTKNTNVNDNKPYNFFETGAIPLYGLLNELPKYISSNTIDSSLQNPIASILQKSFEDIANDAGVSSDVLSNLINYSAGGKTLEDHAIEFETKITEAFKNLSGDELVSAITSGYNSLIDKIKEYNWGYVNELQNQITLPNVSGYSDINTTDIDVDKYLAEHIDMDTIRSAMQGDKKFFDIIMDYYRDFWDSTANLDRTSTGGGQEFLRQIAVLVSKISSKIDEANHIVYGSDGKPQTTNNQPKEKSQYEKAYEELKDLLGEDHELVKEAKGYLDSINRVGPSFGGGDRLRQLYKRVMFPRGYGGSDGEKYKVPLKNKAGAFGVSIVGSMLQGGSSRFFGMLQGILNRIKGLLMNLIKKTISLAINPFKKSVKMFTGAIKSAGSKSKTLSSLSELLIMPLVLAMEFTMLPVLKKLIPAIKETMNWVVNSKDKFMLLGKYIGVLGNKVYTMLTGNFILGFEKFFKKISNYEEWITDAYSNDKTIFTNLNEAGVALTNISDNLETLATVANNLNEELIAFSNENPESGNLIASFADYIGKALFTSITTSTEAIWEAFDSVLNNDEAYSHMQSFIEGLIQSLGENIETTSKIGAEFVSQLVEGINNYLNTDAGKATLTNISKNISGIISDVMSSFATEVVPTVIESGAVADIAGATAPLWVTGLGLSALSSGATSAIGTGIKAIKNKILTGSTTGGIATNLGKTSKTKIKTGDALDPFGTEQKASAKESNMKNLSSKGSKVSKIGSTVSKVGGTLSKVGGAVAGAATGIAAGVGIGAGLYLIEEGATLKSLNDSLTGQETVQSYLDSLSGFSSWIGNWQYSIDIGKIKEATGWTEEFIKNLTLGDFKSTLTRVGNNNLTDEYKSTLLSLYSSSIDGLSETIENSASNLETTMTEAPQTPLSLSINNNLTIMKDEITSSKPTINTDSGLLMHSLSITNTTI